MKGLGETSPFHRFLIRDVINWFIFGHGVVIYYISFVASPLIICFFFFFFFHFTRWNKSHIHDKNLNILCVFCHLFSLYPLFQKSQIQRPLISVDTWHGVTPHGPYDVKYISCAYSLFDWGFTNIIIISFLIFSCRSNEILHLTEGELPRWRQMNLIQ